MNARCRRVRSWQTRTGWLAALCFCLACLALFDLLRGGFLGNQGIITLLPGSSYAISGPLPQGATGIADMRIEGEPEDASVRLVPRKVFSGFWFGGAMWRGSVEVAPTAREARYTVTVKDRIGAKQNPALVFTIEIWPDQKTRDAHAPSWLTRQTGYKPSFFFAAFALCGLMAGGVTFVLGRYWALLLSEAACAEIYRLERSEQGLRLMCDRPAWPDVRVGQECRLYRYTGEAVGRATVLAVQAKDLVLVAEHDARAGLGDVVCLGERAGEQGQGGGQAPHPG